MLHRPVLLWTSAALSWGSTIATALTPVHGRIFACSLGAAVVLSLAAVQQTAVASRIDRTYTAMARAFIQRNGTPEGPAPESHGKHHALTVVRAQDRAAL